jgi:hypothetical protein
MTTQPQHLPLTPPPSPPTRRRHAKKKANDPFLELAKTPLPSPSAELPGNEDEEEEESLLTRVCLPLITTSQNQASTNAKQIILTPLLFTSFLISLFLVNRSDRARRTHSRSTTTTTFPQSILSYFRPTTWLDPEPYQDPSSTSWQRGPDSDTHVEPHSALNPSQELGQKDEGGREGRGKWYLRKKIRKVAKVEISDAFEMRRRVIVLLVVGMGTCVVGVVFGVRWIVRVLWGWWVG